MKPYIITILFSLFITQGHCQVEERIISTDTLRIQEVSFKRTLGFQTSTATIFIDYKKYKMSFDKFWGLYKKGLNDYKKDENEGYVNPRWFKICSFLDSMHTFYATQMKLKDTIYIDEKIFINVGIGPGHDFTIEIENGECNIFDKEGHRHFLILKQSRSYQKDFLNGWGGRRYYFIKSPTPFISGTDWRS